MATIPAYARAESPRAGATIIRPDFTAIENFIKANQESRARVAEGMDLLVRTMAYLVKGYAQQKSMGPVAPNKRSVPALAGRIPVQRITGAYFAGWQVRRVGQARYLITNSSKEAYLIETGLYQRVRRPILKMSLIAMLKFMEASRTEQRFLPSLIGYRRDSSGRFANVPIGQRLMGTDTLGGMAGPRGADDRPAAFLP